MKDRLRFFRQSILLLVVIFYSLQNGTAQSNCVGCFAMDLNSISPVAVGGDCMATIDFEPPVNGNPGGANFPVVTIVSGTDADGSMIQSYTITSVEDGTMTYPNTSPVTVAAGVSVTIKFRVITTTGHFTNFTYVVDALDLEVPVFDNPPMDMTINCLADIPAASTLAATDNCDGALTTAMPTDSATPIDQCMDNTIMRTWMISDVSGNMAMHTQNILVEADNTPPSIMGMLAATGPVCSLAEVPAVMTVSDLQGLGLTVTDVCADNNSTALDVTSADVQTNAGACPAVYTRTYTVSDVCGNAAIATQEITVDDTTAPTFTTAPQDGNADCMAGGSSAGDQFATWVASGANAVINDNCSSTIIIRAFVNGTEITNDPASALNTPCPSGTYTVDFEYSDECNSSIMGTATYMINDTNPPEISTGAADITVECDGVGNGADLSTWLTNLGGANTMDVCTVVADTTFSVNGNDFAYNNVGGAVAAIQAEITNQNTTCTANEIARVTVMFTFTDNCGEISTTDADAVVLDETAPVITMAGEDTTVECDGMGNPSDLTAWRNQHANAVAEDLCSDVTWDMGILDSNTAACGNTSSSTYIFTATDMCGNSTTTTATFTIKDETAPTFSNVPPDVTIDCSDVVPGDPVLPVVSATDVCDGPMVVNFTTASEAGDCPHREVITNTWTATDACGNTATAMQTVTRQDNEAPIIVAGADETVECDGAGNMAALDAWLDANGNHSATDNCSLPTAIVWTNDFTALSDDCGATGMATVTFTATDECGNASTVSSTFTIEDTTNPSFSVPADITIECTTNPTVVITGDVSDEADACDTNITEATFTDVVTDGVGCPQNQTIARTWSVTDACGNSTTGVQMIRTEDTTAPDLSACATLDMTHECTGNAAGNQAATDAWNAANIATLEACATDNCNAATISVTSDYDYNNFVVGTCTNTGEITVNYTVTDACNPVTITATFTIQDNIAPLIMPTSSSMSMSCDNNAGTNNTALQAWLTNYGGAMTTDDCNSATWVRYDWTVTDNSTDPATVTSGSYDYTTSSATSGGALVAPDNNCQWAVNVTFVTQDECDNSSTTISNFDIIDTMLPTFTVPADVTLECDLDPADLILTGDVTDEADNCAMMLDATYVDDNSGLTACSNTGTIIRTWTLMDDCGNERVQAQNIVIRDTQMPTFTVPANVTISCDQDHEDLTLTGDVTDEADNCDMMLEATYTDDNSGLTGCSNTGTIIRTWTLEDACGRLNTQVQTIIVEDTVAPTITDVPADVTVECDDIPLAMTPTVDDNCDDNVVVLLSETTTAGACQDTYTITREWTATDACGNSMIATQTIAVEDTTDPILSDTPADVTVECGDPLITTPPTITATDNCATMPTVVDMETSTAGTCPAAYTLTRTWTATDNCGNSMVHTQVITVEDMQAPEFLTCPEDITVTTSSDDMNDCDADYTFDVPVVMDLCSEVAPDCGGVFTDIQPIVSILPGDETAIVDNVTLTFAVPGPPTVATTAATFTVNLMNIDAELPSEFFFVEGEDGTALGTTGQSTAQCATLNNALEVSISDDLINAWALDGTITITLVPNNPGAGLEESAINDICPVGVGGSSSAVGSLQYDCQTPPDFTLEYQVSGDVTSTVVYPPTPGPATITRNFPIGDNTVTFTATDCSGNTNTCAFVVTVEDDETPTLMGCTAPVLVDAPVENCEPNDYELIRPTGITDNCMVDGYNETITHDILFYEHPNVDGFAATDTVFKFQVTGELPALSNATLAVTVTGDFDTADEYYTITDELGNTYGNTFLGTGACPVSGSLSMTITNADLLSMAADGEIIFYATAAGPINASNDGDWANDDNGINPATCATTTFTATTPDFTADGVSSISAQLMYSTPTVSYAVTGATTIATTDFPMDGTNPVVSLNPGANTLTYYVNDSAGNIDSTSCVQNVTVGSASINPDPVIAPFTQPDCPGDFVVLEETSNYNGSNPVWTWYLDNAPMGMNANSEDAILGTTTEPSIFFPALPGNNNYYVIITDNFCFSDNSASVTVSSGTAPTPPQILASPSPVCEGEEFGLFISNPQSEWVSYEWTGSNGYNYDGQFPPAISSADMVTASNNTLTYILTVTSFTGCVASDTTYVEILPAPEQAVIQTNAPVCDGDALVLATNASCDNYRWVPPSGITSSAAVLNTNVPVTVIQAGTTYYDAGMWMVVCINDNGCETTSEPAEIVISNPMAVASSNNGPACEGEDVQLLVSDINDAVSYQWAGPNGYASTNQNPVLNNVSDNVEGTYAVTVTDINGCTGTSTTAVTVSTPANITAISINPPAGTCMTGADNITLNPSVTPNTGTNNSYQYEWTGAGGFYSTDVVPTLPNGTSIDNGSYTLVVTNAEGCASAPYTVVVDVKDAPNTPALAANANELCEGEVLTISTTGYTGTSIMYTWSTPMGTMTTSTPSLTINATTATDSGEYSVMVTVDGCDSNVSETTTVMVNGTPAMPSAYMFGSNTKCEGDVLQLETDFINGATYAWTGPNGFTASVHNPSIFPLTNASAGNYQVQIELNGCTSAMSAPIAVSVAAAPDAPTIVSNGPICIDDPAAVLTLNITTGTATAGASYEWFDAQTNNSLGTSGLSTSFNITDFSNYNEGNYDFYVIATANGCSSTTSIPTMVAIHTIPDAPNQNSFAGDDMYVCNNMAANLNAEAPTVGSGTWTQVSGPTLTIANPTSPTTSVNGIVNGNMYTFRWTLSNGPCGDYSFDDVSLVADDVAAIAEAGTNIQSCDSDMVTLDAMPPVTGSVGTWTQSAAQASLGVVITDPNDYNTTITGLETGSDYVFTWTLSNNGCGNFDSDIVEVSIGEEHITAYAGDNFVTCEEGFAQLNAESLTTDCQGYWSSPNTELVFADENSATTIVSGLEYGDNMLTWTVDCGPCGVTESTIVITYDEGPVAITDELVLFYGDNDVINVANNDILPGDYTINIINNPTNGDLTQMGTDEWMYTHTGTNDQPDVFTYELCSNSCPDICAIGQVAVAIKSTENCVPPTIITPNNDGVNDYFMVECLFATGKYPNNSVSIFNQWGDEVFREAPYNNDWQGTYNGIDLPVGTYFYMIELGDNTEAMTGFLVIER